MSEENQNKLIDLRKILITGFIVISALISAVYYVENSFVTTINRYCSVPFIERSAIRQLINAKLSPNNIQIICVNDNG